MSDKKQYKMKLSFNILNHLGIHLYSNVPAVLSEVVANAWDADATEVNIKIDLEGKKIIITDDGHGMTEEDINDKYLTVGYMRRDTPGGAKTPKYKRDVMGRKGIGKLSLFSIARRIEIHTVKEGNKPRGFRMILDDINKMIDRGEATYHPTPADEAAKGLKRGTRITLTDLKKRAHQTPTALRKRLARRFSIIESGYNFAINIDGTKVSIADRDYFHKIQYLWRYGEESEKYSGYCKPDKLKNDEARPHEIIGTDYKIKGWIGTTNKSGELKDEHDNLNKITVLVRGKLAQEDILEDFNEGGLYTKYLVGEIEANFLDFNDKLDIATTSRQKINEDDPRYLKLRNFIYGELKHIQSSWTELRNDSGTEKALLIPEINEWFTSLGPDTQKKAKSLFGKINKLTLDSETQTRDLLKHSVLAFESLRYKDNLDALDRISPENLEALTEIFTNADDIEATLYHQIVKERIGIIKILKDKVNENALEKAIQEYLFDHLWLLDPSWERGTETPWMEESVINKFKEIDAKLTLEEKKGRLDLKYKTWSGKHVIIELKRPGRLVTSTELIAQISKYRNALKKLLAKSGKKHEPVECVCIVGKELKDWDGENGRTESDKMLDSIDTRVVMYQELLENAYRAYQEFLEANKEASQIIKLIESIETTEFS